MAWRPTRRHRQRALRGFLDAKLAAGAHPNTVRKYVGMIRAVYRWAYEHGQVSADVYLAVLAVKPPAKSARRAEPRPYGRKDLAALWATLETR